MVLSYFEFVHIDNSEYLSNALSFIFYWLLFSLPIYYLPFLKKHKINSLKFLGLIVIFILILINDANSKMIDNPVTFIGIICIGLMFFSIIAQEFFKKFALYTIAFYVISLSYFFYIRVYIGDINVYLQQEKEIKIILTIPFFILILGWFFKQWKWIKTLESKKVKAELSLLKSQINPHFFFNTLNNLYGLIVEKSDNASSVVLKLSDMMRYTIYMGKEDFVPLKDEIEYLKNYIELHRIRYHKKVDITFNHSHELDYQIAPLLFIIPLENAFKHGVERLIEDAYIHINLKTGKGIIHFEIENNFGTQEAKNHVGIGLENLKQRLKLLYPNTHKIHIEVKEHIYKISLKIDTK